MIIAFPFLGLLSGLLLTSEAKPVWEISLEKQYQCLGYISDEDGDCFLIQGGRTFNRMTQVTALDITTGKELYSKVIAVGKMISGTTYQIISNTWPRYDTLYDWKNEIEMDHFESGGRISWPSYPRLRGDTLAWIIDESDIGTLYYKRLDGISVVKVHSESRNESISLPIKDIEISPDGGYVLLLCRRLAREPSSPTTKYLLVVDLKNGTVIESVPDVVDAQWHSDSSSFMVLIGDDISPLSSYKWQRYARFGTSFKTMGQTKRVNYGTVGSQMKGAYLVVNSTNYLDPIRWHISTNYGDWCRDILNRLWPESFVMHVYRTDTGDLMKSLTLPGVKWMDAMGYSSFMHPNGQGIILRTDKTLAYWDLYPTSRWYPWIGLCVGLLLSILVVRWNLRRGVRSSNT